MKNPEPPFRIIGRPNREWKQRTNSESKQRRATADFHVVNTRSGPFLFAVDGSRFYEATAADETELQTLLRESTPEAFARHVGLCSTRRPRIAASIPDPPAVRSISLQVAQSCNLSCGYCYADEGRFGGRPKMMGFEVAKAAVDGLLAGSEPSAPLLLGFMGGEPLLNWPLIRDLTPYATDRARALGRQLRFSITTNGTLLRDEQARLFAKYAFAVQLSIDGLGHDHDELRPAKDQSSSYQGVLAALAAIRSAGRPRFLTARATVTRMSGRLLHTLNGLLQMGFDDAGFGLAVTSPAEHLKIRPEDLVSILADMKECGDKVLQEARHGRRYPFSNFITALEQIHRGTHRPYPCGAGAAYLSANNEGDLYACHRLVDAAPFLMGSVQQGVDHANRRAHLERSHVDRQEPCQSCWARYLCGGGCYHEVENRGRVACDYIRDWLDYCLAAYAGLDEPTLEFLIARPSGNATSSSTSFGGLLQ